jgi:hypothetical protein
MGMWDRSNMTWTRRHGSNVIEALTTKGSPTSKSPYRDEKGNPIPAGEMILPQGFWVPSLTVPGRYRKIILP